MALTTLQPSSGFDFFNGTIRRSFFVLLICRIATSISFYCTGGVQQWVVPTGMDSITIDAYGAAGGTQYYYNSDLNTFDQNEPRPGGLGGYVQANATASSFIEGQVLYIYVGCQRGYNGGGGAYNLGLPGAGATDIRTRLDDLTSRLVVAGGGGGAGKDTGGGAGGGYVGGHGVYFASDDHSHGKCVGGGGTLTSGGPGKSDDGNPSSPGIFGAGGSGAGSGGGGGGGYFGGGGGEGGCGGGGGSSYVDAGFNFLTVNQQGVSSSGLLVITLACKDGYYFTGSTCLACAAGTYNPYSGQRSCLACDAGTYNPYSASSLCLACSNTTVSLPGQASCSSMCPPGSSFVSGSACAYCDAGKFSVHASLNTTACLTCASGFDSPANATSCSANPLGSSTFNLLGLIAIPFLGCGLLYGLLYIRALISENSKRRVYVEPPKEEEEGKSEKQHYRPTATISAHRNSIVRTMNQEQVAKKQMKAFETLQISKQPYRSEGVELVGLITQIKCGQSLVMKGKLSGKMVAIKIFVGAHAQEAHIQEVKSLRQVSGSVHVISMLTSFCACNNKHHVLIMPLASGTLNDKIQASEDSPMSPSQKLRYCQQIASGLCHMHSKSVAHLDVKSLNVLIDATTGVAMVSDLGLASACSLVRNDVIGFQGTYPFMSPEVWRCSDERVTEDARKVDVYAFAMVIYELLSENEPWSCLDDEAIKSNVMRGERPRIGVQFSNNREGVRMVEMMQKCWVQNAADRPIFEQVITALS